tara:strand:- start:69 stop:704 length:636 start_codon:yes stop_codon:yes gene_type:complete
MDIAIIDYKISNLYSVQAACTKVGLKSIITSNHSQIMNAKIAILPGVGAFGMAMKNLKDLKLDKCIYKFIRTGKPFIGICLGLQLLFDRSEEFGDFKGLGLIRGSVKKFKNQSLNRIRYPVPQIGWNKINKHKISWTKTYLKNNSNNDFMYFIHSYYAIPKDKSCILSKTIYGDIEYCSSIRFKNIYAFQFHPEKSGEVGMKIYYEIKKRL